MNNQIQFSCSRLKAINKKGIIPRDANGYWTVCLGALNVLNSSGDYYPYEESRGFFEKSSLFMRRIEMGVLRSELGHPKQEGMTAQEFIRRCAKIYEQCVTAHIKKVWLDFDNFKHADGSSYIGIMGLVKEDGPFADTFVRSMTNPDSNTCFSVRSFTDDYLRGGLTYKVYRELVTWDVINEPGVATATKYNSPSLEAARIESTYQRTLQRSELDRIFLNEASGFGMESSTFSIGHLYSAMGWKTDNGSKTLASAW